jgi:hypothetical protein
MDPRAYDRERGDPPPTADPTPPPGSETAALSPGPAGDAPRPPARAWPPLVAALVTTVIVTALSWLTPDTYAATLVGLAFLAATWWLVLRKDELTIRHYGMSVGGLLEPLQLDFRRMGREALVALGYVLVLSAIVFPLFALGYYLWWHPRGPFVLRPPPSLLDELAGQLLVIALPEEAFFRGYLQTALDDVWAPRWKVLGARVGPALLVSAAIFAVGHLLTTPHPARLAVFFPGLLFGWLRARTGGIGAAVVFHAACNLFSATLARGYGLSP